MITKTRIMAYLLTASFFLVPCEAFAFLEDIDDVPTKNIMSEESAAGEFSDEGILSSYHLLKYIDCITVAEENFEEEKTVTKGYAAEALGIIASGGREDSFKPVFSDVPENHEYAKGIAQALDKGIIDKTDRFYPNQDVSAELLALWAVRALKYDYIYTDKTPIEKAMDLGFFKGVKYTEDKITQGQFMLFLKNVLDTDYIKISGVDQNLNAGIDITNISHLEKYFNIYKQDGILTGYKYSQTRNNSAELNAGKVQINRGIFNIDYEMPMDYVGTYVDAYIDSENNDLVVSLSINTKKTNVYNFKKADFGTFEVNRVTAYEGNKNVKVNIDDSCIVMYNDTYYGAYGKLYDTLEKSDSIVLIDNDGDKTADIVKAYKYTYYQIKSVSKEKESITFEKKGGKLEVKDNPWIEFIFADKKLELSDLKPKDILTVLEVTKSDNSRIFSAIVTREIEEGVIEECGDDEYGKYYKVEGNRYYLTDEFASYISETVQDKKPKAGDFVQMYLSFDKKVAALKTEDDFSYGYIMSGIYDENEEFVRLRIYDFSAQANNYIFADKVKVYNKTYQSGINKERMEAIKVYLDGDGYIKNDVVGYTLNDKGEITSIVKPIDRTNDVHGSLYYPLTFDFDGKDLTSQTANSRVYRGVFGLKYKMSSDIPYMVIPQDKSMINDEKAYSVKNSNWGVSHYFVNENIKLYNCDKFYIPEFYTMESVVTASISQGDGDVHMVAIEDVIKTVDEDDMEITKISYFENTKLTEVVISSGCVFAYAGLYCDTDEISKLKKGDIIQFTKDALGEINVISVLFSIQNRPKEFGAYFESDAVADVNGNKHIIPTEEAIKTMTALSVLYGRIDDINGNNALINTSKTGTDKKYLYPITIGNSVYGAVYYSVYNTKTNKLSPASLSELQPDDIVVMRKYYNHVQDVVIIR